MARSVFHDLFSEEEAAELEMRAKLLSGINKWLNKSGLTQTEAAEQLGVTQARVKTSTMNRRTLENVTGTLIASFYLTPSATKPVRRLIDSSNIAP